MADRFCRNCGRELAEGARFCTNCGTPVQQAAHIPTPEADTATPQPPPVQQVRGTVGSEQGKVRSGPYWIAFVVFAVLAFALGDDGTFVAAVGVILATAWVYQDASSRGMDNAGAWALGVFFLFIVFYPLYFFRRKPHGIRNVTTGSG
jgi:hypothetical protein